MTDYWSLNKPLSGKQGKLIVSKARELIQSSLVDASHDFSHLEKVAETAINISGNEGIVDQSHLDLIWLLSYCHDLWDHKYPNAENNRVQMLTFLTDTDNGGVGLDSTVAEQIDELVDKISWSKEQKILQENGVLTSSNMTALEIVQDADRLQAIGAIGIARCFTYGGAHSKQGATLLSQREHFDEKLFKITFKTETARGLSQPRIEIMKQFCEVFDEEWEIF